MLYTVLKDQRLLKTLEITERAILSDDASTLLKQLALRLKQLALRLKQLAQVILFANNRATKVFPKGSLPLRGVKITWNL